MNLLTDGVQSGAVFETKMSRKLTINGNTRTYPVYKVRLDLLFYNDQNDRIATWISRYKSEHEGKSVDLNDRETYNSTIESFVVKSNPEAMRKIQTNIELIDQRDPGVVFANGRIIDGNRRFACLRRLAQKNNSFNYFETVILNQDMENSAKQIKMLELSIRHGEENSIDRLAGIYNDIVITKLISAEEYAHSTNEPIQDIKRRIEIAELMVEFLEYINAPLQFHIARDMQIYSPIEELSKLLKRCRTYDEADDLKSIVFTNLLMKTEGDMRTFVHNLKKIMGSDYQETFMEEQKEVAQTVLESLPAIGKISDKIIRDEIRANSDIVQRLDDSLDKTLAKVHKTEIRTRPIQLVEKATDFLDEIDLNILVKLNDSEVQRIKNQLKQLEIMIDEIRGKLN